MAAAKTLKIAIVCGDGAIRGGYIAGVFFGLKHHLPELWQYLVAYTASSASVGGIFYELELKEQNPGPQLWTQDFADKNLINFKNIFKNKKIYDIDYLVDTILKLNNNLPTIKPEQWPVNFFFPLIDYDSGATVIFNNHFSRPYNPKTNTEHALIEPKHLYDYIRAACAAPIIYDNVVRIGSRRFIDAGIRVPLYFGEEQLADVKKIIISSATKHSFQSQFYYWCIGKLYANFGFLLGAKLNKKYYEEIAQIPQTDRKFEQLLNQPSQKSRFYCIRPHQKLGGYFDNSPQTLAANFQQGFADAGRHRQSILEFLKA